MQHATVRTHPDAVGQRQVFVLESAVMAKLGRGVEAANSDNMRAVPLSLVLQVPAQRAHACVQNALGQLGSRKALSAQVFRTDSIMALDERGGELVQEVGPLVGH